MDKQRRIRFTVWGDVTMSGYAIPRPGERWHLAVARSIARRLPGACVTAPVAQGDGVWRVTAEYREGYRVLYYQEHALGKLLARVTDRNRHGEV